MFFGVFAVKGTKTQNLVSHRNNSPKKSLKQEASKNVPHGHKEENLLANKGPLDISHFLVDLICTFPEHNLAKSLFKMLHVFLFNMSV